MSRIVTFLAKRFPLGPYARLRKGQRNPVKSQTGTLRKLLQRASSTEFGRRHRFDEILNSNDIISSYQQNVPLASDADFRADFERMMRGEPDVLWPGTCSYAAVSGGTFTSGLLCPISNERVQDDIELGVASMIAFLADVGDNSFCQGKILTLGGGVQPSRDYPGLLTGEISGVIDHYSRRKKPDSVPKWMAVPQSLLAGKDWDEKIDTIIERSMDQDVRMVGCAASWLLVLMRRLLERYRRDRNSKVRTVGEIWPNLRLVFSGGVPLKAYQTELEAIIDLPDVQFREAYGSTQGGVALQESGADPALSLWLSGGVFFEFVPWEEFESPNPSRCTVRDIQPDVLYVPYLTTCAGLWSYCLGDVVRFSSVKPPRLSVAGRTSEMLDSMGEAVTREDVQQSLNIANQKASVQAVEYFLSPLPANADRSHGHRLVVEFKEPARDLDYFASAFDSALQQINRHYCKWRGERGFEKPEIVSVPPGTFQKYLERSRGEIRFQSKMPRLGSDRTIADELVQIGEQLQPREPISQSLEA